MGVAGPQSAGLQALPVWRLPALSPSPGHRLRYPKGAGGPGVGAGSLVGRTRLWRWVVLRPGFLELLAPQLLGGTDP